jgi:vitamin B12 transporter
MIKLTRSIPIATVFLAAITLEAVSVLPEEEATAIRWANPNPLHTFATPVSLLLFDPRLDVQYRNFPEAQADITVRGSTFDQIGFQIGAASLVDPQTGHYASELPVGLRFLSPPQLLTGSDHALSGAPRSVATVRYRWAPVSPSFFLEAGLGEFGLNRQSLYFGTDIAGADALSFDLDFARSEANGGIPFSDHRFHRYGGRLQWRGETSQTDFFAGYQSKFFGLPNLYAAPFNSPEAENLQTTLYLVNHRALIGLWETETALAFRRNKDDYDFNRFNPGAGNPFQHETKLWSGAFEGERALGPGSLLLRLSGSADSITSTSLTNSFQSHSQYTLATGYRLAAGDDDRWQLTGGLRFDGSNRFSDEISPFGALEYALSRETDRAETIGLSYARSTQTPGYTAIGSPPAGLFGGNPNLDRERADEVALFWEKRLSRSFFRTDVFYRWDTDLVDWVFNPASPNARQARPVDLTTFGAEARTGLSFSDLELSLAYAWLQKSSDLSDQQGNPLASFYAFNYPLHRATLSAVYQPFTSVTVRWDQSFRYQADNLLRRSSRTAWHGYLTLTWQLPKPTGMALTIGVDNLFNSRYEFLPGTPSAPRSVAATLSWLLW